MCQKTHPFSVSRSGNHSPIRQCLVSGHLQVPEIFPTHMESSSYQPMVFNFLFISLAVVSTEQSWPKAFQTFNTSQLLETGRNLDFIDFTSEVIFKKRWGTL